MVHGATTCGGISVVEKLNQGFIFFLQFEYNEYLKLKVIVFITIEVKFISIETPKNKFFSYTKYMQVHIF